MDIKTEYHHLNELNMLSSEYFHKAGISIFDEIIEVSYRNGVRRAILVCSDLPKIELSLTDTIRCSTIYTDEIYSSLLEERFSQRYLESQKGDNVNETMLLGEKDTETDTEEQSHYSDDSLFNISSYGADLSFREIVNMYHDGDLEKPELQRRYVWSKIEASRFVDSILLGLPVPSIFLAKTKDNKLLIVDGFQRIMTIADFISGTFSGNDTVFKLADQESVNVRWRDKTFKELSPEEQRKIKLTTIHAIIFEQKHPENDTGMYQIFERINSSGRTLKPQEIRNCVYSGSLNTLLFELDVFSSWRNLLGSEKPDARMSNMELILRFFAILYQKDLKGKENDFDKAQINLTKHLNNFMKNKTVMSADQEKKMREIFEETMKYLWDTLGLNAFRKVTYKDKTASYPKKINAVIYEAVSVATAYAIEKQVKMPDKETLIKNNEQLLADNEFMKAVDQHTTATKNIRLRLKKACDILYGVKYE